MSDLIRPPVDAFIRGERTADAFVAEIVAICETTPDAAWDALALIDQHHRRGKLSADRLRVARQGIERRMLGVPVLDPDRCPPAAAAEPQDELNALRVELFRTRAIAQRYRRRITVLAAYGRRMRAPPVLAGAAVATATVTVTEAIGQAAPPIARRPPWRIEPWARAGQVIVAAAVLSGVAASRDLRDLLRHHGAGAVGLPAASAAAVTTINPTPPSTATPASVATPGRLALAADRYIVHPGQRSVAIRVDRSAGTSGEVSFRWWTRGAGAKPGRDYLAGRPRLAHLGDGTRSAILSVPILANRDRRHTELFYVVIANPGGGATLGPTTRAAVILMRPDPARAM